MAEQTKAVELKEGANKVTVVGVLVEKNLEFGEYTKKVDGQDVKVENISGSISVRTGEHEVHQIRLRSNKLTNAGKENALYKGYVTLKNELVSQADVAENPELTPSVIKVDGKLTTNEYYGQDGQLRQFQQIEGKFVNRLTDKDSPEPRAEYEVEIFVAKTRPEMDSEGTESGRALIDAYIPTFNAIVPFSFVSIEQGASFFLDDVQKGQTIKVFGKLVNKKIEHVKEIEAAFGEPIREVTYDYVNEALVNSAAQPYDEDSAKAFKPEAIQARLAAREVYLETQKTRASQPKPQSSAPVGFGANATTAPKTDVGSAGVDLSNMF